MSLLKRLSNVARGKLRVATRPTPSADAALDAELAAALADTHEQHARRGAPADADATDGPPAPVPAASAPVPRTDLFPAADGSDPRDATPTTKRRL